MTPAAWELLQILGGMVFVAGVVSFGVALWLKFGRDHE